MKKAWALMMAALMLFTVFPASVFAADPTVLSDGNVTLAAASFVFDGAAHTPGVTVKNAAGQKLVKGTDYTVSIPAGRTNAGSYTYRITGKGAYTGTVSKTFTVVPQTLTAANITLSPAEAAANGSAHSPVVTVKNAAGTVLTENEDYMVLTPSGRKEPGAYTYKIVGMENYTGTVSKTFTVTDSAAVLRDENVTLSKSSAEYTGLVFNPSVTVKNASGQKLVKNTDYTISIPSGRKEPGTYTYVITGKGSYTGTVKKVFTITSAAGETLNEAYISLSVASGAYKGSAYNPSVTVKNAAGKKLVKNTDYKVTIPSGRLVPGSYTYVITGKGSYTGTVNKTLTVTPCALTEEDVELSVSSVTYNGSVRAPKVTVKSPWGTTLTEGAHYTVTVPEGRKDPGVYVYTVTGKGRYTGAVQKTFTIKAAETEALDAANITLSIDSGVYTGSAYNPSVTVRNAAGKKLAKNTDYSVSIPSGRTDAGSYVYTVTGKGAYRGTVKKTLTVAPAVLSDALVTLSISSATYTGSAFNPSVTVKNAAGTKLTKFTDYTVSIPAGRKDPGTYTYVVTGKGNYAGTVEKTLTVEPDASYVPEGSYAITYYLFDGEEYIRKTGVSNPNPAYYSSSQGLTLKNLSLPGYTFNGWYDSEGGEDSVRVRTIPKGSEGEIELYARWTPRTYTVTLDYDFGEVVTASYTFGTDYQLPASPRRDGYRFISWTDQQDGSVFTRIPAGTTGDKYFYANWLSNRNQAWQKKKLDAPLITEYDDVILFAYEIGEIKNVPLDVIKDFGYTMESGVKMEVNETYSASVDNTQMKTLSSTVSKATKNSFAWTFSNEWSQGLTVNQQWMEQNGLTQEEVEKQCKSETGEWYSSTTSFNSWDVETLGSTETHDLATTNDNTKTYGSAEKSHRTKESGEFEFGSDVKIAALKNSVDYHFNAKIAGEQEDTSVFKVGKDVDSGSGTETGTVKMTGENKTSHGGVNSESGRSFSQSISQEKAVSTAVSQLVARTDSYGEEYINKNGSSENQGFESNESTSDEIGSAVTYSTTTEQSTSVKYTISNTKSGCHRYILAGTAHVYGIVGYDISSRNYFTYTFTVLDDERHMMEDYAPQPEDLYHDHEFSGITFEIPFEITEYVDDRIGATEGLEINEAGIVTAYTGSSQMVVVPEYISYLNKNGTRKAVKVVGISDTAFRNTANRENIGTVQLPKTVTEIPAHAFDGCSSLIYVEAPGVTSIGAYAFANCRSLHVCNINETITSLGEHVFDGMDSVTVRASNSDVVQAALQSGCSRIDLTVAESCADLDGKTLSVPSSVSSFTFNGSDKTFTDLVIESDAAKTVISNAFFVSSGKTPLRISSPSLELGQVRVTAAGIALALSAADTELMLYGESVLSSGSGTAMLSRNVNAVRDPESKNTTELKLSEGKLLLCGTLNANGLIKGLDGKALSDAQIEEITVAAFDTYLAGVATLLFDPNGGSLAEADRTRTILINSAYGELPVPVRDGWNFAGWYTSAVGGTQVSAETAVSAAGSVTLYAQWISDWIPLAEAPTGAAVEGTKYTYDLHTTSSSSSLEGWEQTGSTWGSWSGWQNAAVTATDSREVETRYIQPETKQQFSYERWKTAANDWTHYQQGWTSSGYNCTVYESTGWIDDNLDVVDYADGHYRYGPWGSVLKNCWYNEKTRTVTTKDGYTQYRYRDCTYSYVKSTESLTDPTGQENVSNVICWVQVRG